MSEFKLGAYMSKPSEISKPSLVMMVGPYGGGKTYMAASASEIPELRKTLVIDLEGSTTGTVSDFDDDHLEIIDVQKQSKALDIHPVEFFEAVMDQVWEHQDRFGSVVIDTFDVLNNMYLEYFENNSPTGASGGRDGFFKWTETRRVLTSHNGLIAQLKAAPFLAILVMHEERDEDSGRYDFSWTGKGARSDLGQFPDLVMRISRKYHEKKKEWTTEIVTVPTDRGQSKSRFNRIPEVINDDVTLKDVWAMLDSKTTTTKKDK